MLNDIIIISCPLTAFLCFSISHFSDSTYALIKIFCRQKAGRVHADMMGVGGGKDHSVLLRFTIRAGSF